MAEEGKQGKIGTHSERWAAPPPPTAVKDEWRQETCRKCGENFQLDGRRCAAHEEACTGPGVEGRGFPGYMKCRKCGTLTGTGEELGWKLMRQNLTYHERECLGSAEANRTCRGCGFKTDEGVGNPLKYRRIHEVKCMQYKNMAQTAEAAGWTCQCGYTCAVTNMKRNRKLHEDRCKGTDLANRTCKCGFVQHESTRFVSGNHMKVCKG